MNIITMEVTVIVRVTFSLNNSVVDMNGKIKKEKKAHSIIANAFCFILNPPSNFFMKSTNTLTKI